MTDQTREANDCGGTMKKSRPLTIYILFAMILGIVVGYACNKAFPDKESAATVSGYISLVTDLFLRLIKMIIAPLVFSTLVVGIAHMGDSKTVGRIGAKTMGWFVVDVADSWTDYGYHIEAGREYWFATSGYHSLEQSEDGLLFNEGIRDSPCANFDICGVGSQ
jgi:Sodium:dicarboxylate symporter family